MDVPRTPPPPPTKVSYISRNCSPPTVTGTRAPDPELVLECVPHMVVQCSDAAIAVFANTKWIQYTGLSLEDTIQRWLEVVHTQDAEVARSAFKRCLKERTTFTIDYRIRRAFDSEYRWHRVHVAPFIKEGSVSTVFTATDIHVEKVLAKADQDSTGRDEMFHRRVRQASDPIITIAVNDNTIVSFNRAAERELQYKQREIIGQKFTILMDEAAAARHDGPNGYLAQYHRMARKGHSVTVGNSRQLYAKRKDGSFIPITLVVDMYTNKAGQDIYIAVLTIVTHEINIQQELHRSKDSFLSIMSHELRTPLFGLLGMMSMMRLPSDEEAIRELKQMEACTTSLLSIVNNMIDFYKLENLAVAPLCVPLQPRVLLSEVCAHLQSIIQRGVEFKQEVSDSVPQVVLTDTNFIKHIISNLLSNALRFTHQGKVSVILNLLDPASMKAHEILEVQQDQHVLQILISDTGIGIEPEFYPKIFRPFSQMDNSNSRQYGGVGLGLAISKCMTEMLGGVISFKSSVGAGSEFKVLIPVDLIEGLQQCPDRFGSPAWPPTPSPKHTSPIGTRMLNMCPYHSPSTSKASPATRAPPLGPSCPFPSPQLNSQWTASPPKLSASAQCMFGYTPPQLYDSSCAARRQLFSSAPQSPTGDTTAASPISTHPSTPNSLLTAMEAKNPLLQPLSMSVDAFTYESKAISDGFDDDSDNECDDHKDEDLPFAVASPPTTPRVSYSSPPSPSPLSSPSPSPSPSLSPSSSPSSSPSLSLSLSSLPSPTTSPSPSPSPSICLPDRLDSSDTSLLQALIPDPRSPRSSRPDNPAVSTSANGSPNYPFTHSLPSSARGRSISSPVPGSVSTLTTTTTTTTTTSSPASIASIKSHPVLDLRVLVVEDNIMNQTVIKKMLILMQCEVKVAKNGKEALDILFDPARTSYVGYSKFDLVLMDCHMPILDGYQATLKIREWEREYAELSHLRVIALTASTSSENEQQCYRSGMDGFIAKPITLNGLYHYIAAV